MPRDKSSDCPGGGYHDYQVIVDDSDIMIEQCTKQGCGDKRRYNKVKTQKIGKKTIDDKKYLPRHARDMLQPFDKKGEFKREYGRES